LKIEQNSRLIQKQGGIYAVKTAKQSVRTSTNAMTAVKKTVVVNSLFCSPEQPIFTIIPEQRMKKIVLHHDIF
jgi:hypothetical protein